MSKTHTEKDEKRSNKTIYAVCFGSVGLVLILFSILMDSEKCKNIASIGRDFLSHIGIGLLVIGILTIFIDFHHWTVYFEERLSNIVTEKRYLKSLDKKSLISLQTEVLKAYFNNDDIGGTDGFLSYYQRNIQMQISSPFRTNLNLDYLIDYSSPDKTKLVVNETMSWKCKSNGGKIQDSVKWLPSEYEIEKLTNFSITLQHYSFITSDNEKGEKVITPGKPDSAAAMNECGTGYTLSLEKFIDLDNLWVKMCVSYIIPQERMICAYQNYG